MVYDKIILVKNMYEFKSSKEILSYLNSCYLQVDEVKRKLSEFSHIEIDSENRKKKYELKNKLRRLRKSINQCNILMKKSSRVSDEYLAKMIYEYLTALYGDEFVLDENFIIKDCYAANTPDMTNILVETSYGYRVVATRKNYDNFVSTAEEDTIFVNSYIEDCYAKCPDKKYVCIYQANKYSLLVGGKLAKEFEGFDCLKNLAYRLIDLKLAYPSMSDKERYEYISSLIQKRKSKKVLK